MMFLETQVMIKYIADKCNIIKQKSQRTRCTNVLRALSLILDKFTVILKLTT